MKKSSTEQNIQEEADDLLKRLDQNISQPLRISEAFPLPILSSLWTMIQGQRIDPKDQEIVAAGKAIQRLMTDFSKVASQIGLTNAPFMRVIEYLGLTKFEVSFRLFFSYMDGVIDKHNKTLNRDEPPRDFVDRYMLEIEVIC